MEQLNRLEDWETEMDRLERIGRDVRRLRRDLRVHELLASARCLVIVGCVCAAWYLRAL